MKQSLSHFLEIGQEYQQIFHAVSLVRIGAGTTMNCWITTDKVRVHMRNPVIAFEATYLGYLFGEFPKS